MKLKSLWLLLLSMGLLAACSGEKSFSPSEEEVQQATNVTLFQAKDSQNQWVLHADAVDFQNMTHAVLTNPHLLLRQNGQDSAEISGKRGILDYENKTVSIEGDARVHSLTQQILLTTDHFFYDIDTDRVWSDKKTLVTRGTAKITARGGIETDSKLNKIEFKKQSTRLPVKLQELKGAVK